MGNITPNDGAGNDPNLPPNDKANNNSDEHKKPADITPETQLELNAYAEALRQEFEKTNKELNEDTPAEDLQAFWKRHVPGAAAQIVWLSMNAHSESVRANLNKYIIAEAYAETGSNELDDILKKLTTTPAETE